MLGLLHDDGDPIVLTCRRDLDPPVVNPDGRVEKERVFNRWFDSFASAHSFAVKRNQQGWDVYCKHARLAVLPDDPQKKPDCRVSNMWGSRSFLIDLDCGPDRPYASIGQAMQEVAVLIKSRGILQPSLINVTGNGLHLVWCVDDLLPAKEWIVLRHLLYLSSVAVGLKPDVGAEPIDRGIRFCGPEFPNRKNNGAKQTKVAKIYGRIATDTFRHFYNPTGLDKIPNQNGLSGNDDESEWSVTTDAPWNPQESVDHCHIMFHARETGGLGHSFPFWTDLIALTAKATDEDLGRAMAHEFSVQHQAYDPGSVDTKFDDYRNSGNRKHITCMQLGKHAPQLCAQCQFKPLVRSPAGIPGEIRRTAFVQSNPLPSPDYYNTQYGLMRKKVGDEEDDVMVWYGHTVTNVKLVDERYPEVMCVLSFDATVIGSHKSFAVQLDVTSLPSTRELAGALAKQGFAFKPAEIKEVFSAMVAWLREIRARSGALRGFARLGWTDLDNPNIKGFVLGDQHYTTHMAPTKFQPTAFMRNFIPTGSVNTFNQIVNTVMQNEVRPEVHAHLAASLAAPLIKLTPASGGAVLNFYSPQSGAGKSTISTLAASLWGNPKAMTGGVDDTSNATITRLGTLNNLPFFYDEARPIDPKAFAQTMLFRTNHGVDKRRLSSGAQLQEVSDWSTLNILTSNTSLGTTLYTVKNHGDAAAARYLELPYRPLGRGNVGNMSNVGRAIVGLEHCYGHVGPQFAQTLVDNHAYIILTIDNMVMRLIAHTRLDPSDNAGRLHAIAGACIILAADIAVQLNLLPLDLTLVRRAIVAAINQATKYRNLNRIQLTPDVILDQYLRAMEGSRIRTVPTSGTTGRGLEFDHPPVRVPVLYEINQTTREILVDADAFQSNMAKEGQNANQVVQTLAKTYQLASRIIGHGTPFQSGARTVIVLPDTSPWSEYFK